MYILEFPNSPFAVPLKTLTQPWVMPVNVPYYTDCLNGNCNKLKRKYLILRNSNSTLNLKYL